MTHCESTTVPLDCFAFDLKLTQTRMFIKSNFETQTWLSTFSSILLITHCSSDRIGVGSDVVNMQLDLWSWTKQQEIELVNEHGTLKYISFKRSIKA